MLSSVALATLAGLGPRALAAAPAKRRLRIGVVSDTHVSCGNLTPADRARATVDLVKALTWFDAQGVDAVAIPGDLSDTGSVVDFREVGKAWDAVFPDGKGADGRPVEHLLVTGNHDGDSCSPRSCAGGREAGGQTAGLFRPRGIDDFTVNWKQTMQRFAQLCVVVVAFVSLSASAKIENPSETKAALSAATVTPYTHQNFLDAPEEFHFAIVPDRTGGDLRGAWTNALAKVNLLRPAFVMTVGDLIPAGWLDEASVVAQQEELKAQLTSVVPPFYSVVGNHDIQTPVSKRVWQRYFGDNTYYSFLHKNVLFVALDTQDAGISDAQYAWARDLLARHRDVRWTFFFMHSPSTWLGARWQTFEREALAGRRYSVFAGDLHTYFHARRNGNDYYALSVAGGGSAMNGQDPSQHMNLMGPDHGEMDHLTWVTVPKAGKPVVANIRLDGIFAGDYLDQSNSKTTYVTKPYDDPADPAVVARLAKLDRRRQELFYRWDAKTFDRWTAPGGGSPDATWTISGREIRWDAAKGPSAIENTTDYGNADWHFQYKLEKGSEARLVYVEPDGAEKPVEYVMADDLCRPDTWTHGRLAVTGRQITFEINGVKSDVLMRASDRPSGRFQLRVFKGRGAFRGIYIYDLRK